MQIGKTAISAHIGLKSFMKVHTILCNSSFRTGTFKNNICSVLGKITCLPRFCKKHFAGSPVDTYTTVWQLRNLSYINFLNFCCLHWLLYEKYVLILFILLWIEFQPNVQSSPQTRRISFKWSGDKYTWWAYSAPFPLN